MTVLSLPNLRKLHDQTFRLLPQLRLRTVDDALQFVNERGFIFFWPIKEAVLPSLWTAVAGDRPVADAHDDPGHQTWGWKDGMLGKKAWYYARVLRRRNTMISLETAPLFYALSENYGSYEEDYLLQYDEGRMTIEARQIYEALLREGPQDTIALRKNARLSTAQSEGRFNKALDDLMIDFKILPTGVSDSGSWHYCFTYDITARHLPEVAEQARFISEKKARIRLLELYFQSVGAGRLQDVTRLFLWKPEIAAAVLGDMVSNGQIIPAVSYPNRSGSWFTLPEMVESSIN